jgi:membrane fusion protein (multidrug efflux system)
VIIMRYVFIILGVVLLLVGLASVKAAQISTLIGFGEAAAKAGAPPEMVSTDKSKSATWETELRAVGTVVSAKGVELSNDAAGVVSRLHFESGAIVKKGDPLVELDTSVERAQVASLRARQGLAEVSVNRSRALVPAGAAPQSQLDQDESTFASLSADAKALLAQIDRKVVRAPFAGRLGIRAVNLGQYLAPGTVLTVLESTDSVYADFTLPQARVRDLKQGMLVRLRTENGGALLAEGAIDAIAPSLDAVTRNVKVRASIANPGEALRPGMFVAVEVVLPEKQTVVIVPSTAVIHAAYGDSIFTVEAVKGAAPSPNGTARQKFVKLGERRGDFVAITEGLKAGEEVVVGGGFKLRNGASVVVKNDGKNKPELSPRPENR